jgi:hypothetical protein
LHQLRQRRHAHETCGERQGQVQGQEDVGSRGGAVRN